MNITVHDLKVPIDKLNVFHTILVTTGGRYINNPRLCGEYYRVDFIPGDYNEFNEACHRATTEIKETRKDQWYRIAFRRIKNLFEK